ncbi:MAG: cellulose biosynthesis cyclic di-GMP-binding regulatory protein BcsB [Ignavibacteria bacterium]|nr:cellulose biosynthesis cyclic di-GMP-binding regulatory protein BcsB [Ignavibacteria bacterium]
MSLFYKILFFVLFPCILNAQTDTTNSDTSSVSNNFSPDLIPVKLLQSDAVLKNTSSGLVTGFNLDSVSYTISKSTLIINFQNSSVTIPQLSYFTILINGNVLSTRFADSPQPQNQSWQLDIPVTYLKNGYNTISFICWLRSSADPCIDFYNSQDWLKIFSTSGLYFNRVQKQDLGIYNYPFPFFDDLVNNPVNTSINLTNTNSPSVLSAFLKLTSTLNNYISYDKPVKFAINKPNLKNNIVIGELKDIPEVNKFNINDTLGLLILYKNSQAGYNLVITGNNSTGLDKSVYSLSNRNTVNEMNVNPFIVNSKTNNTFLDLPVVPEKNTIVRFSDIGIKDINLGGLFETRAGIRLTKPVGFDIGFGSKLKIKFTYSGNLNKKSSMLSVLVNTKFVGSKNFDLTKDSKDSIEVFIPNEELKKNSWQIEFIAYNDFDITNLECNKRFSDDISTVIEDDSEFEIKDGNVEYQPDLSSFPMILNSLNKSYADVLFWFPNAPDEILLNIAASVSYQAARKNGTSLNVKTFTGETLPEELKNSKVIFLISDKYSPVYAQFKDKMNLIPDSDTSISVKNAENIATTNLKHTSIIETFNSPFTKGIIYSIFAEKNSSENLNNFINSNEINNLQSRVVLINDKNLTTEIKNSELLKEQDESEGFILKNLRYLILGIFFAVIIIFWYIRKLKKRNKS